MNTSRRKFVKTSTMVVAGATLFSNSLFASSKKSTITGIQLYSIKDEMKKDPLGTLKKLANMGYRNVEHANYVDRKFYGYSAKEFKKILTDLGLHMVSGHTVLRATAWDESKKDFTDAWKNTVEDAAVAGQKFVISPSMEEAFRKDLDGLKRFMTVFNKSGELCNKSGMKFGYHNHDFEFNTMFGEVRMYDIILKETDPALVFHQMDMGNMYGAGGRALELLKQYPGRYASLHVKDEIKSETGAMSGYESTILGTGIIPVKEILTLAGKIGGTSHLIIEQESYQGKTPLDCVEQDLQIMKKWGY
jgi:sugar phosphate isomerase/epimerase